MGLESGHKDNQSKERIPLEEWLEPPNVINSVVPRLRSIHGILVASTHEELGEEYIDEWYNLRKRSLSEMQLCRVWEAFPEILPLGFSQDSNATFWVNGKKLGTETGDFGYHMFASIGNEVLCLTPGIFLWPEQKMSAGQRVWYLKQKAPGLVKLYEQGVAVLHGSREEIWRVLGYRY